MIRLWKYIFGDWTKWRDVACTESLGNISIIQTRTEKRTGKRQIRQQKVFVNDSFSVETIKRNMFND